MGWGSCVALGYGAGYKRGSDPEWLWLWHRLAATAPIRPLAGEYPYAMGVALKRQKDKKKQKTKKTNTISDDINGIKCYKEKEN